MHSVYFGWIFAVRITKLTSLKPMTFCFSFQVAGLNSHSETENPLVRRQNHHDPWLVPLIRMCKLRVTSEKKKNVWLQLKNGHTVHAAKIAPNQRLWFLMLIKLIWRSGDGNNLLNNWKGSTWLLDFSEFKKLMQHNYIREKQGLLQNLNNIVHTFFECTSFPFTSTSK